MTLTPSPKMSLSQKVLPVVPPLDAEFNAAAQALAVLEQADRATLQAVLGRDVSHETWQRLSVHVGAGANAGTLALPPDEATAQRQRLQQDAPARYGRLHERATLVLAEQVQRDEREVEARFAALFERLATWLLRADPAALLDLVEGLRSIPLANPATRHAIELFAAIALGYVARYDEALAAHDALLADPALTPAWRGRALNARAVCYVHLGRWQEALDNLHLCLSLWRALDDQRQEAKVLVNMGIIAYEFQQYSEAERRLRQAVTICEAIGEARLLASAQNELGLVHRDQGQWEAALACFERAAAQRRAEGAWESLWHILHNRGEVLLFQGRVAEAIATFEEGLDRMTQRTTRIDTYLHLGLAYQAAGRLADARVAFERARALAYAIERRDVLPHVHYRLGEVLQRLGDATAAHYHLLAGVEAIEQTRVPLRDEELKIALVGRWQQLYEALVLHALARGQVAEAFEWAERSQARAFLDTLLARQGDNGDSRATAADLTPPIASVAELQAALGEGDVLLCYFTTGVLDQDVPLLRAVVQDNPLRAHLVTPARTLCFTLTRDALTVHDCRLDPNLFVSTSQRGPNAHRFLQPPVLERLHAALLGGIEAVRGARRLLLVPHGPLHHVPFPALRDAAGRPLVRDDGPTIAYAPSATVLLRHCLAAPRAAGTAGGLAVGYDGQRLRYTEAEVGAVARRMEGEAWIGTRAGKARLRATAARRRWLHLACHGSFEPADPLASFLELGPDERLTAREVMQTWRLDAELVTLSACQTGVSHVRRGDEPMGMVRAFLSAGARAVLVSLWPVEDLPTFLLMTRFYEALRGPSSGDASAALHDAQRWLRQQSTGEVRRWLAAQAIPDSTFSEADLPTSLAAEAYPFSDPRHWAAFVVVGQSAQAISTSSVSAGNSSTGTFSNEASPQLSVSVAAC